MPAVYDSEESELLSGDLRLTRGRTVDANLDKIYTGVTLDLEAPEVSYTQHMEGEHDGSDSLGSLAS